MHTDASLLDQNDTLIIPCIPSPPTLDKESPARISMPQKLDHDLESDFEIKHVPFKDPCAADDSFCAKTTPPQPSQNSNILTVQGERTNSQSSDESQMNSNNPPFDSHGLPNNYAQEFSSDLSFKKKDLRKARTQSFQSVLSTASLKSMRFNVQSMTTSASRNTTLSASSNQGNAPNASVIGVKDFQSFIQAPVLSAALNFKSQDEDIEIGQQLPFTDKKEGFLIEDKEPRIALAVIKDDLFDDQDTMLQQQRLTLNALKKLSLSPMPIINVDELLKITRRIPLSSSQSADTINATKIVSNGKHPEPYQPAQVDLSSFSSLTRQSKHSNPGSTANLSSLIPQDTNVTDITPTPRAMRTAQSPRNSVESVQGSIQVQTKNHQSTTPRLPPARTMSTNNPLYNTANQDFGQGYSPQRVPPPAVQQPSDMLRRKSSNLSMPLHFSAGQYQQHQGMKQGQHMGQPSNQAQQRQQQSLHHEYHSHNSLSQASKLGTKLRQIKGLRTPMYVPAVLRMTINSLDTTKGSNRSESSSCGTVLVILSDEESQPNDAANGLFIDSRLQPSMIVQSSSMNLVWLQDSTRSQVLSESTFVADAQPISRPIFPGTKSTPTRRHWVKDEAAVRCGIQGCPKIFNFFERRHHCRKCGRIFCSEHTSHYLYINHLAQFTTGGRGTLSRVCNNCISEYNAFMMCEFGVEIDNTSQTRTSFATLPGIMNDQIPNKSISLRVTKPQLSIRNTDSKPQNKGIDANPNKAINTDQGDTRNEPVVGSVPANWTWSSF